MIQFNEKTMEFEDTSSSSSIGEDIAGAICTILYLIIGTFVFFIYAKEAFGIFWGILYSFFWIYSGPIDYFFFQ